MKNSQFFSQKNMTIISLFFLITFFFLGYFFSVCQTNLDSIESKNNFILYKLIVQNSTFYFLIIIGSLFFNISSISIISYNSFIWGSSAKVSICQIGFYKTFYLVGIHISIEIFWILFAIYNSFGISELLFSYFNNRVSDEKFLEKIKYQSKPILLGYLIVIFGCLVEFFVSPLMLNFL